MRFEVQPMDFGEQSSRRFELAVNERGVEDHFAVSSVILRLPPGLHLALQRVEVPLNPVHSDRERVDQSETLGVLGQDRREHA
ncbi:MAG: hypothetical protein LAO78_06575 [Acidobacteriia bacterium]|nr:hypothetical protein [Terriglobia bacterium]